MLSITGRGMSYIGCYIDNGARDLDDEEVGSLLMTPQWCGDFCDGYQYMGVQVRHCFENKSKNIFDITRRNNIPLLNERKYELIVSFILRTNNTNVQIRS